MGKQYIQVNNFICANFVEDGFKAPSTILPQFPRWGAAKGSWAGNSRTQELSPPDGKNGFTLNLWALQTMCFSHQMLPEFWVASMAENTFSVSQSLCDLISFLHTFASVSHASVTPRLVIAGSFAHVSFGWPTRTFQWCKTQWLNYLRIWADEKAEDRNSLSGTWLGSMRAQVWSLASSVG